ncbi:uncharacterized protein J4E78_009101 [Alternaria triticimaculans]|uniref:uncharacterized protein n=1 Tax=Alternaria triticimaculans TaxID=297637 RepID=UPI0020C36267|nr:uncharacterized protein J4E78_009101 [Alternaria triticimaculans]KAI4647125.1 hypothetical protein J4E78_009101 [Alternaria triticimaculans]
MPHVLESPQLTLIGGMEQISDAPFPTASYSSTWTELSFPTTFAYLDNTYLRGISVDKPIVGASDFALVDPTSFIILSNTYYDTNRKTTETVTSIERTCDLCAGPVWIITSRNKYLDEGYMVEGDASIIVKGIILSTKMIQVTTTPDLGLSGSWVVREGKLLGVIYAGNASSSYLHMLPAEGMLYTITRLVGANVARVATPRDIVNYEARRTLRERKDEDMTTTAPPLDNPLPDTSRLNVPITSVGPTDPSRSVKDDSNTTNPVQTIKTHMPRVTYAVVRAVIIYWENPGLYGNSYAREASELGSFFQGLLFETVLYTIPSQNSELELKAFILEQQLNLARRMRLLDAPCLLIMHYGGDSGMDDFRDNTGPKGLQRRQFVWRSERRDGLYVRWYEIQKLFRDITFDVLLLLDCCHVAQDGEFAGEGSSDEPPDRVELLAAAGDRSEKPQPGDGSFTTIMIKIMAKLIEEDHRFDITELYTKLVHRDARLHTTPFYVPIREGPAKRSVVLERLKAPGEYEDSALAWKVAVGTTIGSREPLNSAMLNEMERWLHAEAPHPFFTGLKVERVIRQTASINKFVKFSLPERSGVVAQSLDVSVLAQMEEAWGELHHLVSRYKSQFSLLDIKEQEKRMVQFGKFVERLNAGNAEVIELVEKAVMMSASSSTPALIDKVLEDPVCESLGMTRQLVLRRIICCQQSHKLEGKVTKTTPATYVVSDRLMEEYKVYDEHQSPEEIADMKARVGLLATVLEAEKPDSFRCLQLYGWEHEERHRRFVYHFLIPDEYKKGPITLHEAIKTLIGESRPTLEERLTMAYNIAKAVTQWHRVDWVHQSMSSHNIIFLKSISGRISDRWNFEAPLLHGFDFARPNAKPSIGPYMENIELDIYRHPDLQGGTRDGHKKEHDLYSLGVVLLEIGLWRSSRDLVEHNVRIRQKTPSKKDEDIKVTKEDVQIWMTDVMKNSLATHVGSDYRHAVRTCLRPEFGITKDDERESKLLDAMDKLVLQKLKRAPNM